LTSDKQHPDDLTLRPGFKQPECSIEACSEPPTELLPASFPPPRGPFCKLHFEMIVTRVAKRNYDDLLQYLRKHGITDEPTFTEVWKPEERTCSIPGCLGGAPWQDYDFKPYKEKKICFCEHHTPAITYVHELKNGYRVLREMEHKARRQDSDRLKRRQAILKLFPKYEGTKNYVESICRDLQKQPVNMPQRWLDNWDKKEFRVEQANWFDAYQSRIARSQIQKYISKICTPKLRKPI
jgi:hypothetical protein